MKLQVEEIKYRQSFQTLTICVCFADLCWQGWKTAGKRRGRRLDWKRTGCCRAKAPSAKLFYSSVGKRAEFASVQSKVPFAWHFLDNRSLINHWPWILGFLKGQPRAKTTTREREEGERVLCVRELCAILVTQGACVKLWTDSVFLKSWLIHSSPGMCLRTCTHTHMDAHTARLGQKFPGCYWRRSTSECWVGFLWHSYNCSGHTHGEDPFAVHMIVGFNFAPFSYQHLGLKPVTSKVFIWFVIIVYSL